MNDLIRDDAMIEGEADPLKIARRIWIAMIVVIRDKFREPQSADDRIFRRYQNGVEKVFEFGLSGRCAAGEQVLQRGSRKLSHVVSIG